MSVSKKPMVLVILDGYGYREDQQDNAIFNAKTPVMDALWAKRPHTLIDASGLEVGLPDRQMGNSEVGHVNLGAGRIVYQDLTRLDVEIKERTFFSNPVLSARLIKPLPRAKPYTSWACSLLAAFTATKITSWRWLSWQQNAVLKNLSARFPGWPRYATT
jgi:hypothetical protein